MHFWHLRAEICSAMSPVFLFGVIPGTDNFRDNPPNFRHNGFRSSGFMRSSAVQVPPGCPNPVFPVSKMFQARLIILAFDAMCKTWISGETCQANSVTGTTEEAQAIVTVFKMKFAKQMKTIPLERGNTFKKSGGGSPYSSSAFRCICPRFTWSHTLTRGKREGQHLVGKGNRER